MTWHFDAEEARTRGGKQSLITARGLVQRRYCLLHPLKSHAVKLQWSWVRDRKCTPAIKSQNGMCDSLAWILLDIFMQPFVSLFFLGDRALFSCQPESKAKDWESATIRLKQCSWPSISCQRNWRVRVDKQPFRMVTFWYVGCTPVPQPQWKMKVCWFFDT